MHVGRRQSSSHTHAWPRLLSGSPSVCRRGQIDVEPHVGMAIKHSRPSKPNRSQLRDTQGKTVRGQHEGRRQAVAHGFR